jgi:hypothetical protein
MTWAFSAVGKAAAVRGKAAEAFNPERLALAEPEAAIAGMAHNIIEKAIADWPEGLPVTVRASGHQAKPDGGGTVHHLSLSIEPLWGFVE